jgi:N-acetylneuraminic acid mutarotase
MPTPRFFPSVCALDGKIYVMGGSGHNWEKLSVMEEYDPATDTWTRKADMLMSRTVVSTVALNGKIYAMGGVNQPDVTVGRVEEYDPLTDTWTKKADMPTARYASILIAIDDKIYAIAGGFFKNNNGDKHNTPMPTVEVYDPATDAWTKKDDMPGIQDSGAAYGFVNGKLYLFGGTEEARRWGQNYTTLATVRSYDPETNTLTREADMPSARGEASASVVSGKIYVIGGVPGWSWYPIGAANLPTVEEYTPEGQSKSVSPQGKLPGTWGGVKMSN